MRLKSNYSDNLIKLSINKQQFFHRVADEIVFSMTARIELLDFNIFFREAVCLIHNAIQLFSKGLFDTAFYSIRSAIELARIVTLFSESNNPKESELYKDWRKQLNFPLNNKVIKELKRTSSAFAEIEMIFNDFFEYSRIKTQSMQKYIHKQGYRTFYTWRSHPLIQGQDIAKSLKTSIEKDFKEYLELALKEIAILRLCIDPFPILLLDERITRKIHFESMTMPFTEEFINIILGKESISIYKNSDFYKSFLVEFDQNEEASQSTYDLIHHQYYDQNNKDEIIKQKHLISENDIVVIKIFDLVPSIITVRTIGGFHMYTSNGFKEEKNFMSYFSYDSRDFMELKNSIDCTNRKYKGHLMSYIMINSDDYWIEHKESLSEVTMYSLKGITLT